LGGERIFHFPWRKNPAPARKEKKKTITEGENKKRSASFHLPEDGRSQYEGKKAPRSAKEERKDIYRKGEGNEGGGEKKAGHESEKEGAVAGFQEEREVQTVLPSVWEGCLREERLRKKNDLLEGKKKKRL